MLQNCGLDDSEKLRTCFAAELRSRRIAAQMSQEDLAAKAGLEQSYISLLERGVRSPGLDVFVRLSRALEIKSTTFLARIEKACRSID